MRKILILLFIFLISCETDSIQIDNYNSEPDNLTDVEKALYVLENRGFIWKRFTIIENELILDDDISFKFDNLVKTYDYIIKNAYNNDSVDIKNKQQFHNLIVRHNEVIDITIGFPLPTFSQSVPSEWQTAVLNAITIWNSIPYSKVHFRHVTTGWDVAVSYFNLDENVLARAEYPWVPWYQIYESTGYPGEYISINSNTPYNFDLNGKTQIIMHELGHIVGFRHTDSNDGSHIANTPTSDSESIFNHEFYQKNTNEFSYYDLISITAKYPSSDPKIVYAPLVLDILSVNWINPGQSINLQSTSSGGKAPFSYSWFWRYAESSEYDDIVTGEADPNPWRSFGTDLYYSQFNISITLNIEIKCVVTDDNQNTAYKTKVIYVN